MVGTVGKQIPNCVQQQGIMVVRIPSPVGNRHQIAYNNRLALQSELVRVVGNRHQIAYNNR